MNAFWSTIVDYIVYDGVFDCDGNVVDTRYQCLVNIKSVV